MRLALVGPFPPYRGGIAQFTDMLSSAFQRYGDTVDRISFSRMYPSILFPGRSQTDDESPIRFPAMKIIDSVNPLAWPSTRKKIRTMKPDGVLTQWWHPFFAPSLMGSIPPDIPSGAICHNILPHERFPLSTILTRKFLKRSDLIVAHSGADAALASELSGSDAVLKLYLPVYEQYSMSTVSREESRRMLGYGDEDRVILFFGLIRTYKGLTDLIDAIRLLDRHIRLLVVGECYSGRQEIQQALANESLENRVTWIDTFVPDSDVAGYFRASDLVVLPYRHATQSAVAQTALGFRKAMVLTDTGGLPEVIDQGSTGYLVPPGNPPALAEGIRKCLDLLSDPGLPGRIALKARQFSWDEYVRRVRELWP